MAKDEGSASDANDPHEEQAKAKDREGKELQEIRQRRQGGGRMFLSKIEDFVLINEKGNYFGSENLIGKIHVAT